MFRLQVTIIRQTFQWAYMDMTCSLLTVWDPCCLHCCVEFQKFRLINCSIFNILTNVFSIIYEPMNVGPSVANYTLLNILLCY